MRATLLAARHRRHRIARQRRDRHRRSFALAPLPRSLFMAAARSDEAAATNGDGGERWRVGRRLESRRPPRRGEPMIVVGVGSAPEIEAAVHRKRGGGGAGQRQLLHIETVQFLDELPEWRPPRRRFPSGTPSGALPARGRRAVRRRRRRRCTAHHLHSRRVVRENATARGFRRLLLTHVGHLRGASTAALPAAANGIVPPRHWRRREEACGRRAQPRFFLEAGRHQLGNVLRRRRRQLRRRLAHHRHSELGDVLTAEGP